MDQSKRELSSEDAEAIARKHLEGLNLAGELATRTVEVAATRHGFTVTFNPPAGVRGGPFTVKVDAGGNVQAQRFER